MSVAFGRLMKVSQSKPETLQLKRVPTRALEKQYLHIYIISTPKLDDIDFCTEKTLTRFEKPLVSCQRAGQTSCSLTL